VWSIPFPSQKRTHHPGGECVTAAGPGDKTIALTPQTLSPLRPESYYVIAWIPHHRTNLTDHIYLLGTSYFVRTPK
jgi:hypothetical protein